MPVVRIFDSRPSTASRLSYLNNAHRDSTLPSSFSKRLPNRPSPSQGSPKRERRFCREHPVRYDGRGEALLCMSLFLFSFLPRPKRLWPPMVNLMMSSLFGFRLHWASVRLLGTMSLTTMN